MEWPPYKAWTRLLPIDGVNHFVAINYGGEGEGRWLNLISVLDGDIRIRVSWDEIEQENMWLSGWFQVGDESIGEFINKKGINHKKCSEIQTVCLHSSLDSGFNLPIKVKSIRKWSK